jgi:hypothetical protein
MTTSILATTKSVIKHWYLILIAGVIFIAAGIWVMSTPLSAYLALSILFSVSFFIIGLMEVLFALANHKEMKGWGWTLVFGLFNLLISFILFYDPLISITTLPLYVGFVVLFRSITTIGVSLDTENYGTPGKGSLLALGILAALSDHRTGNPTSRCPFFTTAQLLYQNRAISFVNFRIIHCATIRKDFGPFVVMKKYNPFVT